MSDIEDDDDDLLDDYANDWLYVEDAYNEADELAEATCPSPPPYTEIPDEDVDPYDYYIDLDYLSDGYYDDRADINLRRRGRRELKERAEHAKSNNFPEPARKRRKIAEPSHTRQTSTLPSIIWYPQRCHLEYDYPHISRQEYAGLPLVALFKDWEARFAASSGLTIRQSIARSSWSHQKDKGKLKGPSIEDADEDWEDDEGAGDEMAIDTGDLKDLLGLLNEENMPQLQELLREKGLDPAILDAVLEDIREGKQREFEEEDDSEEEDSAEDHLRGGRAVPTPAVNMTHKGTINGLQHSNGQGHIGGKRKADPAGLETRGEGEKRPSRPSKRGRIQVEDSEPATPDEYHHIGKDSKAETSNGTDKVHAGQSRSVDLNGEGSKATSKRKRK